VNRIFHAIDKVAVVVENAAEKLMDRVLPNESTSASVGTSSDERDAVIAPPPTPKPVPLKRLTKIFDEVSPLYERAPIDCPDPAPLFLEEPLDGRARIFEEPFEDHKIFAPKRATRSPRVIKEMARKGYRPATFKELVRYAEFEGSRMVEGERIIALGTIVERSGLSEYVPCVMKSRGKLELSTDTFGPKWTVFPSDTFLAIRISPARIGLKR
jgi:hypothetical protein